MCLRVVVHRLDLSRVVLGPLRQRDDLGLRAVVAFLHGGVDDVLQVDSQLDAEQDAHPSELRLHAEVLHGALHLRDPHVRDPVQVSGVSARDEDRGGAGVVDDDAREPRQRVFDFFT